MIMIKNLALFCIIFTCLIACKEKRLTSKSEPAKKSESSIEDAFSIEILDKEALQIIDPDAKIKLRASGFTWTEGPLWIEDGRYLLFSDIPNNKVYKLDKEDNVTPYLYPSGYTGKANTNSIEAGSNGLVLDPDGNLVLLQHGDRKVARMKAPLNAASPEYETLVDTYLGKRLNSPNDGVFDTYGNLYFTDPPYGLPKQMDDKAKELSFQGVYCLLRTGELILLDTLTRPNGITLSPDESTLYVAVSDRAHAVWYQYDIKAPGEVHSKRIFYDVTKLYEKEGYHGMPDGMKMNSKGYLFATGPGGVWIFNSAAKVLAKIHTGQLTSNCTLTTDEKLLFMTADDYILSLDLK